MAGLSVEGLGGSSAVAGGNNLGAGAASGAPGALQLVMLQQDNENLVAKVSALEQSLQQLLNNQGGGAGSHVVGPHAADGAGAAVAVGPGLGAAADPGSDADRQRRFAKAESESTASAWRAGRLMWALRGHAFGAGWGDSCVFRHATGAGKGGGGGEGRALGGGGASGAAADGGSGSSALVVRRGDGSN
ncbi:unnamed protein product [Ectocarpus sp. CCAP 1310/34]|nr:unnamed protein product [Ectocarpus sp. CCAP 1310/34]